MLVHDNADAERWFGQTKRFMGFHWHGETFSLPEGSTPLLSSQYYSNQAYAIGKHLAMQCHVEVTSELVQKWYQCWASQVETSRSPAVQTKHEILENLSERIDQLNQQAHALYARWVAGLSI